MKTNKLFWTAFFARIISLFCLALFFFNVTSDLDVRTSLLALGFSFTGWILGSFFLGLHQTSSVNDILDQVDEQETTKELTDDEEEDPVSHPLFKDDTNE